jgi:hypothetical protein
VAECAACGRGVEESFRFCPWCAAPQRLKLVEFFRGLPLIERDRGKALRVSRYLGGPKRHVRFSVWSGDGVAEAAVSIDEDEARRLRRFLATPVVPRTPARTRFLSTARFRRTCGEPARPDGGTASGA